MNKVTLYLLLLFSVSLIGQTTYNITDPEDLENQTYVAGDEIILANGTYNSDSTIDFIGNGTTDDPIIFRAQTPGEVKFTGGLQLNIGGDHVIVDGFHWQGGFGSSSVIEFRNGTDYANNSTIQNCAMDGLLVENPTSGTSTKHNWIMLYGTYNTVINCSFMNKESSGNMVLVELQYNYEDDPCAVVGHTISNNYFYKYEKIDSNLTNANDSETIRIGTSSYQMVNSNCTVSNNYFVEADGENEIITNKSKNNSYINNTFRNSRGSLVLRHGSNATVDGNYFLGGGIDGTGGIRIVDSDHTITNNYIQDCITIVDQAIWNNGITFLGGNDNNSVPCTASNESSGYQQVENITLSNNTIVNTNAPLFYNTDKGSTDPTGTVANNLIYFADDYPVADLTPVISGDTPTSYANLGTALTYTGNVYKGTTLGATNTGFTEQAGITATADGEIFTFSGTGSAGNGADMGSYTPTTDAMVGYGIGACFLNNLGANITDGDCDIVIPDVLTVSGLSTLASDAASYNVTVSANVSWTAMSNDSWITINTTSGTGDATVSVTVTENTETTSRTGSVTFTQDPGGDDIVRTLSVTQDGADLTDLYDLINTGLAGDPVTIADFSQEQVDPPNNKFNYAANILDKLPETHWTAQDGDIVSGDYKGDGEYVIFDLGSEYGLDLIQVATDDKDDPYGLQIWVSTTGTESSDFTMILPTSGDLLITTTTGTYDGFDQYEITATAQYVKLMGYGRFNTAGNTRLSVWNNFTEIEFYGSPTLSVSDVELQNKILLHPNPASDFINIEVDNITISSIDVFNILGERVHSQNELAPNRLDVSNLVSGIYFLKISAEGASVTKKIIIK